MRKGPIQKPWKMTGDQLRMTQGNFGGDSSIIDIKNEIRLSCYIRNSIQNIYLSPVTRTNLEQFLSFPTSPLVIPFGYSMLHHFTVSRAQSQALSFLISFIFGKPLSGGFHYDDFFINDRTEPREGTFPEMLQLVSDTTGVQNQVAFMLKSMFLN